MLWKLLWRSTAKLAQGQHKGEGQTSRQTERLPNTNVGPTLTMGYMVGDKCAKPVGQLSTNFYSSHGLSGVSFPRSSFTFMQWLPTVILLASLSEICEIEVGDLKGRADCRCYSCLRYTVLLLTHIHRVLDPPRYPKSTP